MKNKLVNLGVLALSSIPLAVGAKGVVEKPNFIIILADDLGYGDLGYTGSTEIKTPNIDKLAKNGVVFSNAYVSAPVCSPSRAGLMTGRSG